jgi:hypothetical protein
MTRPIRLGWLAPRLMGFSQGRSFRKGRKAPLIAICFKEAVMLKQIVPSVALLIFTTVSSLQAEQPNRDLASLTPIEWRSYQTMKIPGTNYEITFDAEKNGRVDLSPRKH